jgi:hypothetical protein
MLLDHVKGYRACLPPGGELIAFITAGLFGAT